MSDLIDLNNITTFFKTFLPFLPAQRLAALVP